MTVPSQLRSLSQNFSPRTVTAWNRPARYSNIYRTMTTKSKKAGNASVTAKKVLNKSPEYTTSMATLNHQ